MPDQVQAVEMTQIQVNKHNMRSPSSNIPYSNPSRPWREQRLTSAGAEKAELGSATHMARKLHTIVRQVITPQRSMSS
ncbi:hypothetical protein SERLA73DRAFT_142450 [Serpula lacrymans var. lacrymans S7.3]|uniref:Uncharacterized protein n=2 Tax=Serpula lacrymans var. lacrymans TaxID=341189 RepID=F8Q7U1_SERL3|nr:uncharacterized protein SERLADRAFT_398538 [Serpula lacrymans var. lacrymans S7.9]EGN95629.1 hypothetical protein SERLA73DRAFT_142450 [Serpula lacrymans var. lacrymans S7.3]EGO21157.1 hypothetical protein SERLADRAFT_398538 [Serpula lacrymans var. lacrymans S7.9]